MEAINYLLLFLIRLEIVCNKIYVIMTREESLEICATPRRFHFDSRARTFAEKCHLPSGSACSTYFLAGCGAGAEKRDKFNVDLRHQLRNLHFIEIYRKQKLCSSQSSFVSFAARSAHRN